MDPNLEGNFDSVQMHRVALAATSCLNDSAELRLKGSQVLISLFSCLILMYSSIGLVLGFLSWLSIRIPLRSLLDLRDH